MTREETHIAAQEMANLSKKNQVVYKYESEITHETEYDYTHESLWDRRHFRHPVTIKFMVVTPELLKED